MLKSLSDNLNLLMSTSRINSNELARLTGIPAGTIKRIRNNEQSNPTITTLVPIAKHFSITISQLLGEMPVNIATKPEVISLNRIPLLKWSECAQFKKVGQREFSEYILSERQLSKKAFALLVEDVELSFFPEKAILIVEPDQAAQSGDYVIVTNSEQRNASIRKYIKEIDKTYLKPLIKGLEMMTLSNDIQIIGVVIQYKMELTI